jgi:hypothetical protein
MFVYNNLTNEKKFKILFFIGLYFFKKERKVLNLDILNIVKKEDLKRASLKLKDPQNTLNKNFYYFKKIWEFDLINSPSFFENFGIYLHQSMKRM